MAVANALASKPSTGASTAGACPAPTKEEAGGFRSESSPAELLAAAVVARGQREVDATSRDRFAEALRAEKLDPKRYTEVATIVRHEDMVPSLLWIIRRGDINTAREAALALATIVDAPAGGGGELAIDRSEGALNTPS